MVLTLLGVAWYSGIRVHKVRKNILKIIPRLYNGLLRLSLKKVEPSHLAIDDKVYFYNSLDINPYNVTVDTLYCLVNYDYVLQACSVGMLDFNVYQKHIVNFKSTTITEIKSYKGCDEFIYLLLDDEELNILKPKLELLNI